MWLCSALAVIKHVCMLSCLSSVPFFCDLMSCSLPGSSVHGILRQEYWSGLPCPPPGDLPHPRMEPTSLVSPTLAGKFFTTSTTWEAPRWSIKAVKYQNLQFMRIKHLKPSQENKTHGTRKTQLIRDHKKQPTNAPGN